MVSLPATGGVLMTSLCASEFVVPAKFVSPAYSATTVCEPCARLFVVNVAIPPDNVPLLRMFPSMRKLTVPVGVPALDETVAVNVTFEPVGDGLAEVETAREELAAVMLALRVG